MPEVRLALQQSFGHADFRPGQEEVVRSVLSGRPTIAVLPTGAGKSLCYQLPAVLCEGTAIVVSPLIALMKDQVDALQALGIAAAKITSADSPEKRRSAMQAYQAGQLKLLYVAPERLSQSHFRASLAGVPVSLLAVDEAHCVSQWGHDFRPDYLAIHEVVQSISPQRLAAFTATATPEVQAELGGALGMPDPALFVRGFHRPDLKIRVIRTRGENDRLAQFLDLVAHRPEGRTVLAYASTRRQTEAAAEHLRQAGLNARHYHAGLEGDERNQVQDLFLGNQLDALIATNAFGMGIDKPDIRLLVHLSLPTSLESYYQEVGRAGRDGQGGEVILLYQPKDVRTAEFLLTEGQPDPPHEPHVEHALRKLARLQRYATGSVCRHRTVLEYFGDPDAQNLLEGCDHCDRCEAQALGQRCELDDDQQLIVRKALSGVARTHARYGRSRVAAMLIGANTLAIRSSGLDRLSTYGLLKNLGREFVLDLLDSLEEAGLIQTTGTQYPLLALTDQGAEVMRDQCRAKLGWPLARSQQATRRQARGQRPTPARPADATRAAGAAATAGAAGAIAAAGAVEGWDLELYERLRLWRSETAKTLERPPFTIFHDATLTQIALELPTCSAGLAQIKGIGPSKLESYGEAVLAILAGQPVPSVSSG
jgi:ATP-dependent DNA helicase RecQ